MRTLTFMYAGCCLLLLSCHMDQPCSTCPSEETDTTSHNFVWSSAVVGALGMFLDVAIVNDSLAYAVGDMYQEDSTYPTPYNMARWDGSAWTLQRVEFSGPCSVRYPQIRAIHMLPDNSLLVTNGGSIVRYDGANATMDCRMSALLVGSIRKLYATSPQNIYAGCNGGGIVHFSDGAWQALQTGTTLDVSDIWGEVDPRTGEDVVIAVAGSYAATSGNKLLSIRGNTVVHLDDTVLPLYLSGVWFDLHRICFVVGAGIFYSSSSSPLVWQGGVGRITQYFTGCVRGNAANDVMIAGAYGEILHYNGSTFKSYQAMTGFNGSIGAVAVRRNLVIAVGTTYQQGFQQAIAVIGRRP